MKITIKIFWLLVGIAFLNTSATCNLALNDLSKLNDSSKLFNSDGKLDFDKIEVYEDLDDHMLHLLGLNGTRDKNDIMLNKLYRIQGYWATDSSSINSGFYFYADKNYGRHFDHWTCFRSNNVLHHDMLGFIRLYAIDYYGKITISLNSNFMLQLDYDKDFDSMNPTRAPNDTLVELGDMQGDSYTLANGLRYHRVPDKASMFQKMGCGNSVEKNDGPEGIAVGEEPSFDSFPSYVQAKITERVSSWQ